MLLDSSIIQIRENIQGNHGCTWEFGESTTVTAEINTLIYIYIHIYVDIMQTYYVDIPFTFLGWKNKIQLNWLPKNKILFSGNTPTCVNLFFLPVFYAQDLPVSHYWSIHSCAKVQTKTIIVACILQLKSVRSTSIVLMGWDHNKYLDHRITQW